MVAQADKSSEKIRARKQRAAKSIVDVATKVRIRNLYMVQCLPHKEIARQTGLTERAVQSVVYRLGLAAKRKENEAKTMERHDALTRDGLSEVTDAIAAQAEEYALGGLKRSGEALQDEGEFAARNFQSWTGGVKNLVQVAKLARGATDETPQGAVMLNLFCVRGETVERIEKSVTPAPPAIEV